MTKPKAKHPKFVLFRDSSGRIVIAGWYHLRHYSKGEIVSVLPIVEVESDREAWPASNRELGYRSYPIMELKVADLLGSADTLTAAVAQAVEQSAAAQAT